MALVVVGDGLVELALVLVGIAPVVVGNGVLRVEGDGLVEVGDGLVELALVVVGIAPVVVGSGILRVEGDGLVVVGDGLVEARPCLSVGKAPVVCRHRRH